MNTVYNPSNRKYNASEGETDRIRIEETGGTLPKEIDLWVRIVGNGPGEKGRGQVLIFNIDKISGPTNMGSGEVCYNARHHKVMTLFEIVGSAGSVGAT